MRDKSISRAASTDSVFIDPLPTKPRLPTACKGAAVDCHFLFRLIISVEQPTAILLRVAQPPLIVAAIIETLENQDEIDVQRALGVELQISGVHASLRRRVQEAGQ